MKTIFTTFLLIAFSVGVFSKPIVHIRNRHNGGLFGYKSVINSSQEEDNFIYHIVDCSGPGGAKCRNHGFILPDGTNNSDVLESIMNRIDEDISNGNSKGGKFNYDNQYYVIWSSYTVDDRIKDTITIYTLEEAKQKGLV